MIIGIDNGKTGGLVALSPIAGCVPVAMRRMPLKDGKVDVVELRTWLRSLWTGKDEVLIALEQCPDHADRVSTMRSMASTHGRIEATVELLAASMSVPVTLRSVRSGNALESWQRKMLGKVPKGQTKVAALEAARAIWPQESWIPPGCHTPHDGIIDAALIAEFCRRNPTI